MCALGAGSRRHVTLLALAALGSGAIGCERRASEPQPVASGAEPSPNASVLPAPLAAGPAKAPIKDAGQALSVDAGADAGLPEPPRSIRDDDALPAEAELQKAPGLVLEARFRWFETAPARLPETNVEAVSRARDKTALELNLELSSLGRLRIGSASRAYPLPPGAELRAREDRYGHLLLWPDGTDYTPLAPGALRAVLNEARLDVTPLADPNVVLLGPGAMLGSVTQKQRLETSIGKLELEQAPQPAAGSGGALLCRLLVELLAVSPESSACRSEWVPLRAEYTWASGARLELEVTKLGKRLELSGDQFATPPPRANVRRGELPGTPLVALLDERELGEFRTRALLPTAKAEPGAPKLGLVFHNRSDGPRYLLVDGVPVVWLRRDAEWLLTGLKPGRYTVQARDFFGADTTPPKPLNLPARFLAGDEPERAAH